MPKKIVVIDDDVSILALVKKILGSEYDVLQAEDGVAGLELVISELPDLVILDFAMPLMHGFEVCRKIRSDARVSGIKILMSSSKSYPSDIRNAADAGVNGYLVKPYRAQNLRKIVEFMLSSGASKP